MAGVEQGAQVVVIDDAIQSQLVGPAAVPDAGRLAGAEVVLIQSLATCSMR